MHHCVPLENSKPFDTSALASNASYSSPQPPQLPPPFRPLNTRHPPKTPSYLQRTLSSPRFRSSSHSTSSPRTSSLPRSRSSPRHHPTFPHPPFHNHHTQKLNSSPPQQTSIPPYGLSSPPKSPLVWLFYQISLWSAAVLATFVYFFFSFITRVCYVHRPQETCCTINPPVCAHGPQPQQAEEVTSHDHCQRERYSCLPAVTTTILKSCEKDRTMGVDGTLTPSEPLQNPPLDSTEELWEMSAAIHIDPPTLAPAHVVCFEEDYAGPRRPPFPRSLSPSPPLITKASPSSIPFDLPKKQPGIRHHWPDQPLPRRRRLAGNSESFRSEHWSTRRRRLLSTTAAELSSSSSSNESDESQLQSQWRTSSWRSPTKRRAFLARTRVPMTSDRDGNEDQQSETDQEEEGEEAMKVRAKLRERRLLKRNNRRRRSLGKTRTTGGSGIHPPPPSSSSSLSTFINGWWSISYISYFRKYYVLFIGIIVWVLLWKTLVRKVFSSERTQIFN